MNGAFYEPLGHGDYLATAATAGPWTDQAQHGGPPSALAARAIEAHEPDLRQRLARVAIDILRPVPVGKVSVRTRMIRPGRRVALVEAVMEADGQEVLHARGWRIERPAGHVPEIPRAQRPLTVPETSSGPLPQIFSRTQSGYLAAIEWRFLDEQGAPDANAHTGRAAWTRPRVPLLAGEELSPMCRALLIADSGSGVGAVLPASDYLFINVDLSVVLSRDPAGDWLLLDASTRIGPDGTGLATSRLADREGRCGRGWQTLLVAPAKGQPAPQRAQPAAQRITARPPDAVTLDTLEK